MTQIVEMLIDTCDTYTFKVSMFCWKMLYKHDILAPGLHIVQYFGILQN